MERLELKKAFNSQDTYKDGIIPNEKLEPLLQCVIKEVNDELVEELLKDVDYDKDGMFTFEDLCRATKMSKDFNMEFDQETLDNDVVKKVNKDMIVK